MPSSSDSKAESRERVFLGTFPSGITERGSEDCYGCYPSSTIVSITLPCFTLLVTLFGSSPKEFMLPKDF